ncbi:uncharacterized protein DDB_G0280315-like [Helianthus annuus]|uniref:uncharacterized protein DDB_G0280315-like n=1 Tax=Helianthus annuus TaxID=4232 RepID=UPI000B8FC388|nr:uncharacterized protein DDB_G0280315-like [Helianthus annuus]
MSIHLEYSDDRGNYDDRVDDDGWGYVNRGNVYNAIGFDDDEFGYQNANFVGNDNYGYGNVRNDGYGNNRNPRNNNQRNQNDGFYNNNNNELARMKKKEVGAVQYSVCEECGDIGHRTRIAKPPRM